MNYNYPILEDWSTEELVTVMELYSAVESAYESGVSRKMFMEAYHSFKKIVPSKSEEKTLFKELEKVSGYVAYEVVKVAKDIDENGIIKVTK